MDKKEYNLLDEVISSILEGEESLESWQNQQGRDLSGISRSVELALQLNVLGEQERAQTSVITRQRVWDKISAGMVELAPNANSKGATDSGSNIRSFPKFNTEKPFKFGSKKHLLNFLVKIAASFLIFALLSSTFIGVAQASNPGDFLYDTKLTLDRWDEIVSFSNADKVEARLRFASKRLNEIERSVEKGSYNGLEKTISSYEEAVQDSLGLATDTPKSLVEAAVKNDLSRLQAVQSSASIPENVKMKLNNLINVDVTELSKITDTQIVNSGSVTTPAASPTPTSTTVIPTTTVAPSPLPKSTVAIPTTQAIIPAIETTAVQSPVTTPAVTAQPTTSTSNPSTVATTQFVPTTSPATTTAVTTTQPTQTPVPTSDALPTETPGATTDKGQGPPQTPPGQAKTTPPGQAKTTPPGQAKTTPPGANKTQK